MIPMLMLMSNDVFNNSPVPAPSSVIIASHFAGACQLPRNGTITLSAYVRVTWTIANPNDALYQLKIYRNGTLVTTALCSTTELSDFASVSGMTEEAPGSGAGAHPVDAVYRVDVVITSTGVVVSTASSPTFTQWYGYCH